MYIVPIQCSFLDQHKLVLSVGQVWYVINLRCYHSLPPLHWRHWGTYSLFSFSRACLHSSLPAPSVFRARDVTFLWPLSSYHIFLSDTAGRMSLLFKNLCNVIRPRRIILSNLKVCDLNHICKAIFPDYVRSPHLPCSECWHHYKGEWFSTLSRGKALLIACLHENMNMFLPEQ